MNLDIKERTPHYGEMELCLCSICASGYYNMPDRRIERVDMFQTDKDVCTLCNYRLGYDFYVWPIASVRIGKKHSNRIIEKVAEDE